MLFVNPFVEYPLSSAAEVVRFSFLAHETITYLDLSTCEYSSGKKFVNTVEGFEKLGKRRKLLYDYHLDVIRDFDEYVKLCSNTEREISISSHLYIWSMPVSETVYNQILVSGIEDLVSRSENPLKVIQKFYSSWIMSKLREEQQKQLKDYFARILMVYLVSKPWDLAVQIFTKVLPELLDFILKHAQSKRFDLWCEENKSPYTLIYDAINGCIFFRRLEHVKVLLKYRDAACHDLKTYVKPTMKAIQDKLPFLKDDIFTRNITEGFMSSERNFFLFQVVYAFVKQHLPSRYEWITILRSLWRSIPDPYLSCHEWTRTFRDVRNYAFVLSVSEFYMNNVCESEDDFRTRQPRCLAHLCRTSVRGVLCRNNRLPSGIGGLGLPSELEAYLRLEY